MIYNKIFGFHYRYNQHLIQEHSHFHLQGLRTRGILPVKLDQALIPLTLTLSHQPQQARFLPTFYQSWRSKCLSIWDWLRFGNRYRKNNTLVFLITGAPGSGKTTLLQHITLTLATQQQRRYRFSIPFIPLLLFLPHYVEQIVKKGNLPTSVTLATLLQQNYSNLQRYPQLKPPSTWFERQLKAGNCLVLLDGLNAVGSSSQQQTVVAWIEQQIVRYPQCQFIITSRALNDYLTPINEAHVLEIEPLAMKHILPFTEKWYLTHEAIIGVDYGVIQRAKQDAYKFWQLIKENSSLQQLASNPQHLIFLAMRYRSHRQLPSQRQLLYSQFHALLMQHSGLTEGIADKLSPLQRQLLLQQLAADMMQVQKVSVTVEEVISWLLPALPNFGMVEADVRSFLREMQSSNGILIEVANGQWQFTLFSFQEYLAALHWLSQAVILNWNQWVADSWWHESLHLYALAQDNRTQLLPACLANDSVAALLLAISYAENSSNLDETGLAQLSNYLINHLSTHEPTWRRLAARFILKRRIKTLHRIDERREIDLNYLTHAEYQLFIDELRSQEQYRQPDHWQEYYHSRELAASPITGIRAEDTKAFCVWLAQREGGHYRLPTPLEAKTYSAMGTPTIATWCQHEENEKICGLVWHDKPEEHAILTQLETLSVLPLSRTYDMLSSQEVLKAISRFLSQSDDIELSHNLRQLITLLQVLLDRNLDAMLDFNHYLNLVLNLDSANLDDVIYAALEQHDFQTVRQVARIMQTDPDSARQRLGILLEDMIAMVTTTYPITIRQALRKYTAALTATLWQSYEELEHQLPHIPPSWLHRPRADYQHEKQLILNLHWWLQMGMLKENNYYKEGWEGIRLVREEKNSSPEKKESSSINARLNSFSRIINSDTPHKVNR